MKKTRLIFCLISFLSVTFYAQAQFSGAGSGTANDPYQITTASQLNQMHNYEGAAGSGVHFKLMNDIDLADLIAQEYDELGWDPIGSDNDAAAFYGFLHGGDFTISNIWISNEETDYIGLFGYIKNGGVDHLKISTDETNGISGRDFTGALAGAVEASSITYSDAKGNISGASYVGGLIGAVNQDATIQFNTTTDINIVATGNNIGGLAGQTSSPVSDCASSGEISTAGDYIGGLIGKSTAEVSNSTSSANLTNTGSIFVGNFMGGLIGAAQSTVTNASASGAVNGTNVIGGLVGDSYAPITNSHATGQITGNARVGGLVGASDAVTNCYATGAVIGDQDYMGGLAGQSYGAITLSYANGAVSGTKTVGGLVGASNMPVSQSFASGNVTQTIPQSAPEGGFIDIGGLIGNASGTVTNCYATGNVTAVLNSMYIGGLIGLSANEVSYCYASGSVITEAYSLIGGLIGDAWAPVSNCVAANPVVSGLLEGNLEKIHRIAGTTEFDATITNCYALETTLVNGNTITTGTATNLDGQDKALDALQTQVGYDDDLEWDFAEIWTIREGHGYPYFGSIEYLSSIISASINNSEYGTITPIGDVAVQDGSTLSFEITPKEGHEVESVWVDGENIGIQSDYTFSEINANHTIQVLFTAGDLGIDKPETATFIAYPNPVINTLNLSAGISITAVEIYNLQGQRIMTLDTEAKNQLQLDMSGLASGAYLVKINSQNTVETLKIVKQ